MDLTRSTTEYQHTFLCHLSFSLGGNSEIALEGGLKQFLVDVTIKSLLICRFPLLLLFSLNVYVLWFFAVVLFFCRNQVICSIAFPTLLILLIASLWYH